MHIKGAVKDIPWRAAGKKLKPLGDDARQCGLDGEPAASLDALYEVAALAMQISASRMLHSATNQRHWKVSSAPARSLKVRTVPTILTPSFAELM